MSRISLAVLALAACGTSPDTRPETADYISEAILVPSCGRAACHSSDSRAHNLAFDNITDSIAALKAAGGGRNGQRLVVAGNASTSRLYTVLTDTSRIMPPDQPLLQVDIDLIGKWINDGADGLQ